jgi:Uma2 family endonuclease
MLAEQQKLLNADEFWELLKQPENADKRWELYEGVIHEMAGGTGGEHGEITHQTARLIGNFVADHKLGRMTAAETCYVLYKNPTGKDTVHCPDVGFVTIDRAPKPLTAGYVPFAPDFAVEVMSPGNDAIVMHNKVLNYLRYGTRLVWIIYPDSQTIVVHTKAGAKTYTVDDTLDGADVLHGFTLSVKDIFPS